MMAIKVLEETGEIIDFKGMKSNEVDTWDLCGAKHEIDIGITKMSDRAQPVPFDDYIIVYFRPYDTSGGGESMLLMQKTMEGSMLFLQDDAAYRDAMAAGRAGAQDKYDTCVAEKGRGNCKLVLLETGAFTGLSAVGSGASYIAGGAYDVAESVVCVGGWLCAETDYSLASEQHTADTKSPFYSPLGIENRIFRNESDLRWGDGTDYDFGGATDFCENPDDPRCGDMWGENYHGVSGNTHKVRITITNTFEGKTVTRYRYDLSGCSANYDESLGFCYNGEVYKRFLINSPGTWNVKVEPIATASCQALDYEETATFEVTKPEGWEPAPIQALSTDISTVLQEAGVPVAVSPVQLVLAGSLVGGFLIYKVMKKIKAKKEE